MAKPRAPARGDGEADSRALAVGAQQGGCGQVEKGPAERGGGAAGAVSRVWCCQPASGRGHGVAGAWHAQPSGARPCSSRRAGTGAGGAGAALPLPGVRWHVHGGPVGGDVAAAVLGGLGGVGPGVVGAGGVGAGGRAPPGQPVGALHTGASEAGRWRTPLRWPRAVHRGQLLRQVHALRPWPPHWRPRQAAAHVASVVAGYAPPTAASPPLCVLAFMGAARAQ